MLGLIVFLLLVLLVSSRTKMGFIKSLVVVVLVLAFGPALLEMTGHAILNG